MPSVELSSAYIKKLNHPIKEIRERCLQLLLTKLRLGWELDDELGGTRELLQALLAWFQVQKPSLQREALELLHTVVKTKAGTYIAKEIGVDKILFTLNKIKNKLESNSLEIFDDTMETLHFLNTIDSQANVTIPHLKLTSDTSSTSNGLSSGYYNLSSCKTSSKDTSSSHEDVYKQDLLCSPSGVNVLLLPWVDLNPSDLKTVVLIGDSLKVLKSTRRCCRFIRDVFLRDFPVEIFLNRPAIVKTLLAIADGQCGAHPEEALHTLLCITQSLHKRFSTLFSLDLVSQPFKYTADHQECNDDVNAELELYADNFQLQVDDALVPLRQLPVPIYALETLPTILTIMARGVLLIDSNDENEVIDMNILNTCLCLVKSLINLLLVSVSEDFWVQEHKSKIHRDIAHKSCMAMRMLGDLMTKFKSSYDKDSERTHHRVAWLRLVSCAERLLNWTKKSSLAPSSLVVAIQAALIDPALELFYPETAEKLAAILFNSKILVDQEYKSKYRELNKLYVSMNYAVEFTKIIQSNRISKNILTCIKNSLPILHLNVGENYLKDVAGILLKKCKDLDFDDSDWSIARSIALTLMAHSIEWVQVSFYQMLNEMVKSILMGDDEYQAENETCLTLICDVAIFTEICCHGLSSTRKEVERAASSALQLALRGRLALGAARWRRVLAALLPALPLLHAHAAHDTPLGKAICKSLEEEVVDCMGVSKAEMILGLVRLLFVNCAPVQLDAAYALCKQLDDEKYLPPRESLRSDVLLNALRRVKPQDFNVEHCSSPSEYPQTAGLVQIIDVLKQDLVLNEDTLEYTAQKVSQPALEPSLRRSTLQQLAVLMRQQEMHEAFLQNDGLNLIVSLLRLSLMVDDYLAFPECAISCVSVLNSVCFVSRHTLAKISDLPLLLIRVILVFPANESSALLCAQVLALAAWAGFVLQERGRPALPRHVLARSALPFLATDYWAASPHAEHSPVEWLMSEEAWRDAVSVRWWWAARSPPRPSPRALASLHAACIPHACARLLRALENATAHAQVTDALDLLLSYSHLVRQSRGAQEVDALQWQHTRRFLSAPPASPRDTALLAALLNFIVAYMDNMPKEVALSWILSSFIGSDAVIISLLSQERLYPQQTLQEDIELTQLRVYIVKVLLRCVIRVEQQGDFSCSKMESLLKILLTCLERIDLKNFHMLGYLNELIRCVRYAAYSRYCKLSEETLMHSLHVMTRVLGGCTSTAGRKGHACRLEALLVLLSVLKLVHEKALPPQRWSVAWEGGAVRAVVRCAAAGGAELRAAALYVLAALARHAPLATQLAHCIEKESLSQYAIEMFSRAGEANIVRAAAAALLTTITSKTSSHTQIFEHEVLRTLEEGNFLEDCLHILVDFLNHKEYKNYLEPNVPLSLLERESEFEVRAQKNNEIQLSPSQQFQKPPPTAALVVAIADVIYNITIYKKSPVKEWNEQGLYRLLFKCAVWSGGPVRAAACRALCAAAPHAPARAALAAARDCLHNFLATLTPVDEEDMDSESVSASTYALHLLAMLLSERAVGDVLWTELQRKDMQLFHLLLQALENDDNDFQEAAIHCITELARSISHKKCNDASRDRSYLEFFDNYLSPHLEKQHDRLCAGDSVKNDCQPEYLVEEFSRILMNMYQDLTDENKCLSSQDERWQRVCAALVALQRASARVRVYCVHRHLPRALLAALQRLRDALSLHGKPAEVIRNADHEPTLNTLDAVLTLITSSMYECPPAKDLFAEDIAPSLARLWPWCMMTERLRDTIMCLLVTFTNGCAKAWSSVCVCVCGRSAVQEVCALAAREAARPRSSPLLARALRVLRQCAHHHHCRTIIIKSDVLSSTNRARARSGGSHAAGELARLGEALARHGDGAAALLAAPRPAPLAALAHAAHHHRLAFLQSPDLLETLSAGLLTGDTAEVVSAARAVWALAANNHRAKLVLRSAAIPAAVQSSLQRLQRNVSDEATQRAVQLLTYTLTVLKTT